MNYVLRFIDFLVHLDVHLDALIQTHGSWVHGILFLIVFCETGFVVTPFLPGDSLLFAVGTFSARGSIDLFTSMVVLSTAAILGDTVNYWIGHYVGPRVFRREDVRWLNRKHLDRTHEFFEKYGAKTIILARFVPIVRTFAPFVAGVGAMTYGKFFLYNVVGGILWVVSLTLAGYFFGNIPIVRKNFSLVILGIIVVSVLPAVTEALRHRRRS
ncbi:MAG: DedA family protein [Thermoanaerobaculum sp.]|nr:DedA family protein [Thermoanaerobaculum sp.]MDW7966512.1 DedA family protein [Thermoanaerobaculum sp.]